MRDWMEGDEARSQEHQAMMRDVGVLSGMPWTGETSVPFRASATATVTTSRSSTASVTATATVDDPASPTSPA